MEGHDTNRLFPIRFIRGARSKISTTKAPLRRGIEEFQANHQPRVTLKYLLQ
jgi:hypothetical protein